MAARVPKGLPSKGWGRLSVILKQRTLISNPKAHEKKFRDAKRVAATKCDNFSFFSSFFFGGKDTQRFATQGLGTFISNIKAKDAY